MTQTIMHPVYGAISYEENIWTGKKSLAVNGKYLKKGRKMSSPWKTERIPSM